MTGAGHRQLGQILLDAGLLDDLQLRSALGHQRQWGGRLGRILVELRFIDEAALAETLAKQLGLESVRITGDGIDAKLLKLVPQAVAERYWVFPVAAKEGGRGAGALTIAVADPTNLAAVEDLRFHTGKRIEVVVAPESDIESAIRRYYYGDDSAPLPGASPDQEVFDRSSGFLGAPDGDAAELEPPAKAGAPTDGNGSDPLDFFGGLQAPSEGGSDLFGTPPAEGFGGDDLFAVPGTAAAVAVDLLAPASPAPASVLETLAASAPVDAVEFPELVPLAEEAGEPLPLEPMAADSFDSSPAAFPTEALGAAEPAAGELALEPIAPEEAIETAIEPVAAVAPAVEPQQAMAAVALEPEEPAPAEAPLQTPVAAVAEASPEPPAESLDAVAPAALEAAAVTPPSVVAEGSVQSSPSPAAEPPAMSAFDAPFATPPPEAELSALDGLEATASQEANEPAQVVKPGQLVSALVRLLIQKGCFTEAELIQELQRR